MNKLDSINIAVVGHVEWVSFVYVENMPSQGLINHGKKLKEEPAGGGAVSAVQMSKLSKNKVHFFTALGKDSIGQKCYEKLCSLGIKVHVAWREKPTRRGFSFVDSNGDRAITIIGERLQPMAKDPLPWELLNNFDGVFISAADWEAIRICRQSKVLCATPRVSIKQLNKAKIKLDALINSNFDPDEQYNIQNLDIKPKLLISTEGHLGGKVIPGGRYDPVHLNKAAIDSYGCGDSFAAGFTTGLAANWSIKKSINLGAMCGAECATQFGPYNV